MATASGMNNKNQLPTAAAAAVSSLATKQINDSQESDALIPRPQANVSNISTSRQNLQIGKQVPGSNPRSLWKIPDHFQKPKSSDGEGGKPPNSSQSQQPVRNGNGGSGSSKRESFSATRGNAIRDMIKNFGSEATKPSTPQPIEAIPQQPLEIQQQHTAPQAVSITPARVNDLAVPKYKTVKIMSASASKDPTSSSSTDPSPPSSILMESATKPSQQVVALSSKSVGASKRDSSSKTRTKFGVVEKLKARCTPVPSQPSSATAAASAKRSTEVSQLQLIPQESHHATGAAMGVAGGGEQRSSQHSNTGNQSSKLYRGKQIYGRPPPQQARGKGSVSSHKKFESAPTTGAAGGSFSGLSGHNQHATTTQPLSSGKFLEGGDPSHHSHGGASLQNSSSSGSAVVTVSSIMTAGSHDQRPNFVSFPRQDTTDNAALKAFELQQGHAIGATAAASPRTKLGGGTGTAMMSSNGNSLFQSQRTDSQQPNLLSSTTASASSSASTSASLGSTEARSKDGGALYASPHTCSLQTNAPTPGGYSSDHSFHGAAGRGSHPQHQLSVHPEASPGVSPDPSPPPARDPKGFAAPHSSAIERESHHSSSSSVHFPSFHPGNNPATTTSGSNGSSLFSSSPVSVSFQSAMDPHPLHHTNASSHSPSQHHLTAAATAGSSQHSCESLSADHLHSMRRPQNNATDSLPSHHSSSGTTSTSTSSSSFGLHHPLAPWNQNRPFTSPVFNPPSSSASASSAAGTSLTSAAGALVPSQINMRHSATDPSLLSSPSSSSQDTQQLQGQQTAAGAGTGEADLEDIDEKQSAAAIQLRNARRRFRQSSQIALTRKWPGGLRGSSLAKLPADEISAVSLSVSPRVKSSLSPHDQRDDSATQQPQPRQTTTAVSSAAPVAVLKSCLKKSRQQKKAINMSMGMGSISSIIRRVKFASNVTVEYFESLPPLPSDEEQEQEAASEETERVSLYRPMVPKVKIHYSSSSSSASSSGSSRTSSASSRPRNVEEALEQSRKERERWQLQQQREQEEEEGERGRGSGGAGKGGGGDDDSEESNSPILTFAKERFTVSDLMTASFSSSSAH
jgi:hypothetical protein